MYHWKWVEMKKHLSCCISFVQSLDLNWSESESGFHTQGICFVVFVLRQEIWYKIEEIKLKKKEKYLFFSKMYNVTVDNRMNTKWYILKIMDQKNVL